MTCQAVSSAFFPLVSFDFLGDGKFVLMESYCVSAKHSRRTGLHFLSHLSRFGHLLTKSFGERGVYLEVYTVTHDGSKAWEA